MGWQSFAPHKITQRCPLILAAFCSGNTSITADSCKGSGSRPLRGEPGKRQQTVRSLGLEPNISAKASFMSNLESLNGILFGP